MKHDVSHLRAIPSTCSLVDVSPWYVFLCSFVLGGEWIHVAGFVID